MTRSGHNATLIPSTKEHSRLFVSCYMTVLHQSQLTEDEMLASTELREAISEEPRDMDRACKAMDRIKAAVAAHISTLDWDAMQEWFFSRLDNFTI